MLLATQKMAVRIKNHSARAVGRLSSSASLPGSPPGPSSRRAFVILTAQLGLKVHGSTSINKSVAVIRATASDSLLAGRMMNGCG